MASKSLILQAKFWMKMGFVDNERNWLHPEEALFLMEVNSLEVFHHGVSLSLQEAYSLLLHPSCDISDEEYQVFAHLRRLGYIVFRHAGKLDVTPYEMKVGLYSYTKKKNRKQSVKSETAQEQISAANMLTESASVTKEEQQQDDCVMMPVQEKSLMSNSNGNKRQDEHLAGDDSRDYSSNTNSETIDSKSALQQAVAADCAQCERQCESNRRNSTECKTLPENDRRGGAERETQSEDIKENSAEDNKRESAECELHSVSHKKYGVEHKTCSEGNKRGAEYDTHSEGDKTMSAECEGCSKEDNRDGAECDGKSEEGNFQDGETPELALTTKNSHKRTQKVGDGSAVCDTTNSEEPPVKKVKLDGHCGDCSAMSWEQCSQHSPDPWSDATQQSFSKPSRSTLTEWDFSAFQFPDMGGRDTVLLSSPPSGCLPPNTCVDEEYEDVCLFDVEGYRQQQQPSSVIDQGDNDRRLKKLDFSYAEWYKSHFRPVVARNWRAWKQEMCQQEKSFLHKSPVAHLWQGEVSPLVQPQHSVSTASLLQKLSVIQLYKGPFPAKESVGVIRISFDVYLPNKSFKKSRPALPDHRVCVARGDQPPDVFDVHAATAHLGDGVPLHWAVVNSGDICFFVFDNIDLPVYPSSLG